MVRTAFLLASRRLPKDERKHWVQTLQLQDPLEKLCAKTN
jgi:hypothetical protein